MDGPYRATKLWNEMLHTFKHGMPLKRHRRHMRIYESCFTGAEAVNWLQIALKENPNIKPGISKNQVRQLLNKFLKAGVFCSVCGSGENQEFKESEVYRFSARALLLHSTGELPRNASEATLQDPLKPIDVPPIGNRVPMFNIANCNDNFKKVAESQNLRNSACDVMGTKRPQYAVKEPYPFMGRVPVISSSYKSATVNKPTISISQMPNANLPVQHSGNCSKPYRPIESHVGVAYPGPLSDRYDVTQTIKPQQKYLQHEANAYFRNLAPSYAPPEKHGHLNAHKPHRSPSYEFACHKVKNIKLEAPQSYHENVGVRSSNVVNYGMKYERYPYVGNSENCSIVAPVKPPRALNSMNMENRLNLPQKPLKVQNSLNTISMHDARGNHQSNTFRRNPAVKITSDNSSQFPPSEVDGCAKYFVEEKRYASRECNAVRENPSDHNSVGVAGHRSSVPDVFDALNMAFVLRLETVLAGMEEIAALLPNNIRMDWLIRNVLEQSEKFKRSASVDSGLDERPEDVINNFREELTGIMEPLVNIEMYSIIAESFLYVEHINTASKQFVCKSRETIPTTRSIENLVLGMASPNISNGKLKSTNEKDKMLPTSFCYETAFASDTPVTRIIPQCTTETVHLTRRGMSRSFRSSRERTSTSEGRVHEVGVMKRNASMSQMPPTYNPAGIVWRSKSSQDVKEFEDDFVNRANTNHPTRPPVKAPSRRQRSWRINKKHSETKEKNAGLQHCRNRSGGYVNPALSQSWEDLSHSLNSQEFDYASALESLQDLMRNANGSHGLRNDNVDSSNDGSSESSSYHTAASTPDRQKYSNASLTKEFEQRKWKQPALGLGISIYQLLLLLLPPSNRSSLKRLLRCLHNLPTAIDINETNQVIQSMSPKILAYEEERDKSLPFRVVKFFVTFYKEILEIPADIHSEVFRHLPQTTQNQKMTYCEQVTQKQFAEQGLSSSQKALSELLEQIVKDPRMGEKEKKRKLKMFKDRYPDIFRQHFPDVETDRASSDKTRGILQLPSFGKRKNIRV